MNSRLLELAGSGPGPRHPVSGECLYVHMGCVAVVWLIECCGGRGARWRCDCFHVHLCIKWCHMGPRWHPVSGEYLCVSQEEWE